MALTTSEQALATGEMAFLALTAAQTQILRSLAGATKPGQVSDDELLLALVEQGWAFATIKEFFGALSMSEDGWVNVEALHAETTAAAERARAAAAAEAEAEAAAAAAQHAADIAAYEAAVAAAEGRTLTPAAPEDAAALARLENSWGVGSMLGGAIASNMPSEVPVVV